MIQSEEIPVHCPECKRRQLVDVPPDTPVSIKCLKCGARVRFIVARAVAVMA